ncbi:telomere length regulation protein elg1 [Moelleriella libera RCEF 2490]|uniref:Telomere length regulation protein elg1 n=1 Tax=Moelleriella libera RCEF 2490 TaxID=1081109 RepID=A0A168F982_9HYPO|nr:telomere length regulation protein elg1 [Moelleriella libera RCEF 2490]
MSQGGIGGLASQKLHPFFSREAVSESTAVAALSQDHKVDDQQEASSIEPLGSKFESKSDLPPAKRHKSEHPPSQCPTPRESNALKPDEEYAGLHQPPNPSHRASTSSLQTSPALETMRDISSVLMPTQNGTKTSHEALRPAEAQSSVEEPSSMSHPIDTKCADSTAALAEKKVLRFNAETGTLCSPPKVKHKAKPSLMVRLKYGKDASSRAELGAKIAQILDGTLLTPNLSLQQGPAKELKNPTKITASTQSNFKATHPFFTSMGKAQASTPSEASSSASKPSRSKTSVFMSTPVSPNKSRISPISTNLSKGAPFGIKSLGFKVPGAMYPMWPPRGLAHIRSNDAEPPIAPASSSTADSRKSKGQVTTIEPKESFMAILLHRIGIKAVKESLPRNEESFAPVPPELRTPQRHFESGYRLQQRIRPQLTVTSPLSLEGKEDESQDELAGPAPAIAHPAVTRHYVSLASQLSSYDKSTCESKSWNQKYTPNSSSQVLQRGKDALHIKRWLEAMRVQSVEKGKSESTGDKSKSKLDAAPSKKRKKTRPDDFIVDTDDDSSGLEETSENESEGPELWQSRKSVVRSRGIRTREPGRLRNTIVISGPHGCGKTAAVYAVAEELGYEVFEINSGGRRSGKDILEKVGDMTQNHLVQQHQVKQSSGDAGTTDPILRESTSSKQGTMTSFFKTKTRAESKKKWKQNKRDSQPSDAADSQTHKQSLILIEEADVLYEEDKQFWATLMVMMSQSKRPFVVTCNDENLVPLQSLNVHGIFRFSAVPMPLAVDVCVLIAANEGHALRRTAVEALYRSRGHDLRATLCDLNFWCQIGVGDRRGGFDWFYSRWPRGSDLDERGDVVRVISENTYDYGMGWVGRDAILSACDKNDRELEAMQQAWDFWQVDAGACSRNTDLRQTAPSAADSELGDGHLMMLEVLDRFYQSQSDADIYSKGIFATQMHTQLDPTQPEMPARSREDFIIGRTLLDANEPPNQTTYSKCMALALKARAREQLMAGLPRVRKGAAHALGERTVVSKIDSSFSRDVRSMSRLDIANAFDPIAVALKAPPTSHLDASVFDRTMGLIVLDVAPWVRGIIASEHQLMQERVKLNMLLSEGGTRKRMRQTRSAYSALEGGERTSTRRERYFGEALSTDLVMRTGGGGWQNAIAEEARWTTDVESSQPPVAPQQDATVS